MAKDSIALSSPSRNISPSGHGKGLNAGLNLDKEEDGMVVKHP